MADTSIRKFAMSFGELIGICSSVYGFMQRDADEFELFGINSVKIEEYNDLLQEFINLPQDQELEADEKNATLAKNDLANELRIALRSYNTRAKLVFKENTGTYGRFYKKDLSKLNDRDLHLFAELVKDSAEEYLSELSAAGLTQEMIDEFGSLVSSFYDAMFEQTQAIANRDNAANLRVKKANELYDLLVRYTDVGKNIWYEVNEAKYNDYIIYGGGSGGSSSGGGTNPNAPAAPTNFRYDFAEVTIRWDAVNGATSYQLESSTDNTNWTVLFDGDGTEYNTGEILPEHTYLRIKSRSANGLSNPALLSIVYNLILNGPTNLTHNPALPGFTWNPVAGATVYEVQLRSASGTDDDYIQLFFGNATQLLHADQVGTYYVRIRAINNSGLSGWMLLAYQVNP